MPLKVFRHLWAPSSTQCSSPLLGSLFTRVSQPMASRLTIPLLLSFSHQTSTSWRCSLHLSTLGITCIFIPPFYHGTSLCHCLLPNLTSLKQRTLFLPAASIGSRIQFQLWMPSRWKHGQYSPHYKSGRLWCSRSSWTHFSWSIMLN